MNIQQVRCIVFGATFATFCVYAYLLSPWAGVLAGALWVEGFVIYLDHKGV